MQQSDILTPDLDLAEGSNIFPSHTFMTLSCYENTINIKLYKEG